MKAIIYERFGAAADVLTLSEIDSPAPATGEVRVALTHSGVNPSDVKSRAGSRPGVTKPAFSRIIPHSDGAGVIDAVGEGVDAGRLGQRVWVWNGQWQRPLGTAASHITLPVQQAVPLPDSVSNETGAVLGIPGLTAAHAVFGGGEIAGKTLLISGGGGTVGYLAVQLVHWGGAKVIATCSPRDHSRVRDAGADHVFNYADANLAAQIIAANEGAPVDRIVEVEFGANVDLCAEVIAPNGIIAAYGSQLNMTPTLPFGPLLFKAATIDVILVYLLEEASRNGAIGKLHAALESGNLTCPVEAVYPLADTVSAHEAVENGNRAGAILIDCTA